jgi:hypothetical protein
MKRRIDLIDQHLEGRTFNDEKVRVAETALCPKSAATRDSSRRLAIARWRSQPRRARSLAPTIH